MGNRSHRELEAAAILRDVLAHPPREIDLPMCEICGEEAVIGAYTLTRVFHFCRAHRAEADMVFGLSRRMA